MKIKIIEYEIYAQSYKGGKVKVQSHNFHKKKWKVNKKYDNHKRSELINSPYINNWKEYSKEINK